MLHNLNGGDGTSKSRQVVAVLAAVLIALSGVTAVYAGSTTIDDRTVLNDTNFTSFGDTVWSTLGSGSYDDSNDRVVIADGSSNGALARDAGVPNTDSWAVSAQLTASAADGSGVIQFYTDSASSKTPSNGYEVVVLPNTDTVRLDSYDGGESTTVKSVTSSAVTTSNDVSVEYDAGTVHVHVDGNHAFATSLDNPDTGGQAFAVRAWHGSGTTWAVTDVTVYGAFGDSDDDGMLDANDPFPYDAPTNYSLSPDEDSTVSSAYVEANNGSADVTLYGSENGSETKLTSTTIEAGSQTKLTEIDATRGFDSYRLYVHGNASISDTGLLYEATGSGGVSEETYNSGIDSVLSDIGSLSDGVSSGLEDVQRGQMMLGGLILAVGLILFLRD